MKNKFIINTFLIMLLVFVIVLALPADKKSIEAENRVKATMPPLDNKTVLSGKFASGFESFLGDSVGLRSLWTSVSKSMDTLKGVTPKTGAVLSSVKDIGTGKTVKQNLLVVDNKIMEMFVRNSKTEKEYTDVVNYYAEKLPDDIRLFNMLIPTQLEFQEPIYKNVEDSQRTAIEDMYAMLDDNITAVDVCDILEEHSDEYIYFRTDHHWTALGAYYAYLEFIKGAGGNAADIDDYEKHEISGLYGSLYDRVERRDLVRLPDTVEWYDVNEDGNITTDASYIDKDGREKHYDSALFAGDKKDYQVFLGGDHAVAELTNSENQSGKTLIVIKDSYSNALAPWLITSYKKVVLVDPRNYTGTFSDILDKYSPDEVLIANYIFTTVFEGYSDILKEMYE